MIDIVQFDYENRREFSIRLGDEFVIITGFWDTHTIAWWCAKLGSDDRHGISKERANEIAARHGYHLDIDARGRLVCEEAKSS